MIATISAAASSAPSGASHGRCRATNVDRAVTVFAKFPDARFSDTRHFVAGDRGVSEWTFTGTSADGRAVEVNGCDLFTFRDGKIAVKSSFFKTRTS